MGNRIQKALELVSALFLVGGTLIVGAAGGGDGTNEGWMATGIVVFGVGLLLGIGVVVSVFVIKPLDDDFEIAAEVGVQRSAKDALAILGNGRDTKRVLWFRNIRMTNRSDHALSVSLLCAFKFTDGMEWKVSTREFDEALARSIRLGNTPPDWVCRTDMPLNVPPHQSWTGELYFFLSLLDEDHGMLVFDDGTIYPPWTNNPTLAVWSHETNRTYTLPLQGRLSTRDKTTRSAAEVVGKTTNVDVGYKDQPA